MSSVKRPMSATYSVVDPAAAATHKPDPAPSQPPRHAVLKPATYDTQRAPLPYRIRCATLTQHPSTTSNVIRRRPPGARALVAYARLRFPWVRAPACACLTRCTSGRRPTPSRCMCACHSRFGRSGQCPMADGCGTLPAMLHGVCCTACAAWNGQHAASCHAARRVLHARLHSARAEPVLYATERSNRPCRRGSEQRRP
jgi:hypothetical protein